MVGPSSAWYPCASRERGAAPRSLRHCRRRLQPQPGRCPPL